VAERQQEINVGSLLLEVAFDGALRRQLRGRTARNKIEALGFGAVAVCPPKCTASDIVLTMRPTLAS
jgi:hypothetical protein